MLFAIFFLSSFALFLAIIFLVIYPIVRRNDYRENFLKKYGKKIYDIANKNDYYLINELSLKLNDDSLVNIDHLLLANKYLFLISDYYFEGTVENKIKDRSWIYYYGDYKKPNKMIIDNALMVNDKRVKKFLKFTKFDKSFVISVVVVNNDCKINELANNDNDSYIVKIKNLEKLVKEIEGRDVGEIDQMQLLNVVNELANRNEKK